MTPEKLILFIERSGHVTRQQSEEIASSFSHRIINRNDYFLKKGRVSDEYLFLDKGFMRAFALDPEGNEVTTHFYSENGVVFEVSSFFNRMPSEENIQALTDCEGWVITFEKLNHLFHSLPYFREFGRQLLVKGFAALKIRMLSMITETAEQRYDRLLQHNSEIFQYAPLKHIATYLGITDTSLSRIRKEYSKKTPN